MHCCYLPSYAGGDSIELPDTEAHHVVHVLRADVGTRIRFTNGIGITGLATLTRVDKKQCTVHIDDATLHTRSSPSLHIGVALLHNSDRMAFMMEKLTELGVHRITPFITANTERRHFKREKELAHMVSALKQSAQPFLPQLDDVVQFLHWLPQVSTATERRIAHCRSSDLVPLVKTCQPADMCIAIGPEGDFTEAEVEAAINQGFIGVSLGVDVLRAETAAMSAVMTIKTWKTLHA
jgi:16S rRNA (uracil1498-N3)-methyltransferase